MDNLLLIIEVACIAPLILNSTPYKMIINHLDWNDVEFVNCCLCTSTYIAFGIALTGVIPFISIPLIAVLSELIDAKINDF